MMMPAENTNKIAAFSRLAEAPENIACSKAGKILPLFGTVGNSVRHW
jgi:hypothetical protein